jgi:aspartate-semialdehyde dehydrogenase
MDPDVPLVVPEVNSQHLKLYKNKNIIANANCSVIPLVVALKPLHDLYDIKRIVASTYQSVSGAGKSAMDELLSQTKEFYENKELKSKYFTKQIAFNAIPHIDKFLDNGYTKEEQKMHDEVKKILDTKIKVTSTSVRIPVLVSHAVSVNVEFNRNYKLDEIRNVLGSSPGCKLVDKMEDGGYVTPVEAENKYETFISRIRKDDSQENTINLWIVSDNLLKGAALNAVEIAETLIKNSR